MEGRGTKSEPIHVIAFRYFNCTKLLGNLTAIANDRQPVLTLSVPMKKALHFCLSTNIPTCVPTHPAASWVTAGIPSELIELFFNCLIVAILALPTKPVMETANEEKENLLGLKNQLESRLSSTLHRSLTILAILIGLLAGGAYSFITTNVEYNSPAILVDSLRNKGIPVKDNGEFDFTGAKFQFPQDSILKLQGFKREKA